MIMKTLDGSRTRGTWLAVALAVGTIVLASPARAGFLMDFSGNTAPQALKTNGMGTYSTVNFAVLDLSGQDATDPWGTGYTANGGFTATFMPGDGSKALDTKAAYLYLFQVTNNQPANIKSLITNVSQEVRTVDAGNITSWGYFAGLGLADKFGEVTPTNFFGNTRTPGNPAKANVGVSMPSVVSISGGIKPDSVALVNGMSAFAFTAKWPNTGLTLASQDRSLLFGFTSSEAPAFRQDLVISVPPFDGVVKGTGVTPFNPFAVPEPSSLTSALMGVVMVSVFCVGRRGKEFGKEFVSVLFVLRK
jgi:hypothetical protein